MFTHFPPVDPYNSDLSAGDLAHAEKNFAEHGLGSVSLVPFGHGDGGGGPTREMIARDRRVRSLEGSPTLRFGSPREFFLDAESDYPDPPVWVGEMYLELHRGTYTSQSRTKQGNRRSEHLLREAELWATTAAVRFGVGSPTTSCNGCGASCCCSSSTTSCRAARSRGCTGRPSARTPTSPGTCRH